MQNEKTETPETIKWKDIKEFVNKLDDEQLEKQAYVCIEDSNIGTGIKDAYLTDQDVYFNIDDSDDCGTLEDLKEIHGEDFVKSKYELSTRKGTPFLWAE